MKKITIATTALLSVAMLPYVAFAQMGGRGIGGYGIGGPGGGQGEVHAKQSLDMATAVPDFLLIDLNLSGEQASQITILRDAFLRDIKPLKEEIFNIRIKLSELSAGKRDEQDKIVALRTEIKDIRGELQGRTAQYLQAVRKLLAPEQRSQLRYYWTIWDGGHFLYGN